MPIKDFYGLKKGEVYLYKLLPEGEICWGPLEKAQSFNKKDLPFLKQLAEEHNAEIVML